MMDIQHTGSKIEELICIKTSRIALTIKGKATYISSDEVIMDKISMIKLQSQNDNVGVYFLNEKTCSLNNENIVKKKTTPLFYEQRNYEIIVEFDKKDKVEFWHENINIRNKITESGKLSPRLSGVINFRNDIGYSDLIIILNDEEYLKITIEIFPSKLNYQDDYRRLLEDVSAEIYNLTFDFLKRTYQSAGFVNKSIHSQVEYYSILSMIFEKFINAIDIIISQPHHELENVNEIVKAHKVRRSGKDSIKWIQKHPEAAKKNKNGNLRYERAMTSRKQVTYDTNENRFTKYIIKLTIKDIEILKRAYLKNTQHSKIRDQEFLENITRMQKELSRRLDFSFMKHVGVYNNNSILSLVFGMAAGYKEVYEFYLMLKKGLSINNSIFRISIKDMAQLYEYWCFIKLNSILKEKYNLVRQNILKIDNTGMYVSLKKGMQSKVEYINPITGEKFILEYNRGYTSKNLPTVSQKPDNVLSISKGNNEYQYIFDAKYRINMARKGSDYYNQISSKPGPEESDINTMHRYRDAIVYKNDKHVFERSMFGAFVLFPYNDEIEYKEHSFYKSIEAVNIGGLPFLPGATTLVESFLDELIQDSADSAFERATLPLGIEEKLQYIDLSIRDVMVVLFRNKDQFEKCIENNIYYIPENLVADERFPIKYLATHQSKNHFGDACGISYYGEVKRVKKVKRSEIIEVMMINSKKANQTYYYFEMKSWKKLDNRIELSARMRRANYYTNYHLLKSCKYSNELLFESLEQYRLYSELVRLIKEVEIVENDDRLSGFEFNRSYIFIKDNEFHVVAKNGEKASFYSEYLRSHMRTAFNKIAKMVES